MTVGDVPTRGKRRGAQSQSDAGQAGDWPDYFEDVVDVIVPPACRRDPRNGYATGLSARPGALPDVPGRHTARHGKPRRSPENLLPPLAGSAGPRERAERARGGTRHHAGVAAALTAAAFVGTGVGAGMFGAGTFTPSAAPPDAVTTAVPVAGTLPGGAPAQHHAGYAGKHRKPVPAGLAAAHPQTSAAAGRPAAAPAPSASPSPAASGSQSPAGSSSGSGPGQSPAPVSPSPSSTPRNPASPAPSSGSGSGGRHSSGGQGLVGGLVGSVTGLLGGLGL
jgi:hypothetical protein